MCNGYSACMQIFPILKEYHWVGKHFALFQNLLDIDREPMPLIAYGYNQADQYQFLTTGATDQTIEQIHAQALANLAAAPAQWEGSGSILTGSGYDFSAEKILDPGFIAEAQRLLGSTTIEIAIPRRTIIYATAAVPGTPAHDEFSTVVWRTWLDDSFGNAPITPMVFRFDGAQIVGATVLEPQA
ncbi:hypothetical protein A5785_02400 [Gordonia sp. 852002-50395_SCH5434458]|nr:hypothetical protein A5785_02400 [Gordonia sp. 852002-50395_SCH5434458]